MSVVTIDGTDYSLNDGDYNLAAMFKKDAADQGHIQAEVFNANVVTYHSDESFKNLMREEYEKDGENAGICLLVAFSGPQSITDVGRAARRHGLKASTRSAAKRKKPWEAKVMAKLAKVMHKAGQEYFEANMQNIFEECGVPNDKRVGDFVQLLVNSGKGNLGSKVHTIEETSQWGKPGPYAVTLAYRLDINNRTRASNKAPKANAPVNGAGDAAQAK